MSADRGINGFIIPGTHSPKKRDLVSVSVSPSILGYTPFTISHKVSKIILSLRPISRFMREDNIIIYTYCYYISYQNAGCPRSVESPFIRRFDLLVDLLDFLTCWTGVLTLLSPAESVEPNPELGK